MKRRFPGVVPVAALSVLLASSLVQAQAGGGGRMMRFDANGDGLLDRDEYQAALDFRKSRMEERGRPWREPRFGFDDLDADGDGVLRREELMEARQKARIRMSGRQNRPTFDTFDRDGDGYITEEEFNQARAERMAKRAEEGRPMRNAGQGPAFSRFDADGDGRITREEFEQLRRERMERMQGNARPMPLGQVEPKDDGGR